MSAPATTAADLLQDSSTTPLGSAPANTQLSSSLTSTTPPQSTPMDTTGTDVQGSSASPPSDAPSTAAVPVRRRTLADYRLGRTLGEGSYSTVVAAVDLSNRRDYAIKVLDKRHIIREKKVKYVNIEKNTLYKLDHPGIVKLYSTFQDNSSLYYVLELCQNGELLTFIKRLGSFDENCTRFYAAQILTAIEYVHSQGVIHRDLKPENILLDHRMYIKLTDFGTAKMLESSEDGTESDRANSFVGTAEYVSPELLTEKAACKSSDLWALGCIIYQLLAGRPPFKGPNEYQTFQKIVKLEYSFPAGFPAHALNLVSRLLVHDPNERLGANNTLDELKEHPFFAGIEWGELWNQPAPKLVPYLPPTPAHNTEPLRSEHDAFLYGPKRGGDNLPAVDPFQEPGDSRSSLDNSGGDSIGSDDGLPRIDTHEVTNAAAATGTVSMHTTQSLPELTEAHGNGATVPASNALAAQGSMTKSPSATTAINPAAKSSESNGNTKNNGLNGFVALFNLKQNASKKLLAKKPKSDSENRQEQVENVYNGIGSKGSKKANLSRENSSVALAVAANENFAHAKRAQLDLQAEFSPWQGFLLSTEMVIYQSPVLKRKGLFSRACILVLTDFPRLLYFDDSNHYFSQLFNSNTNDAFSSKLQQQRFVQWDQPPNQHASQEPQQQQQQQQQQQNVIHAHGAHPRKSTGGSGVEGLTTGSGFVLARNGSSKLGHQQARSEYIPPGHVLSDDDGVTSTQQGTSTRSARVSLEHPPHHHHQHSHLSHHPQQTNGHNKIDVEKRADQLGGSLALAGAIESSSGSTVPPNEQAAAAVSGGSNGVTSVGKRAPSASPTLIKASKKTAKLRGEIFFTASVVSEIKGKKCFFIHTNKKSYYFEELKEGDADRWVKVLTRCMEEWFGELGGTSSKTTGAGRRYSKQLD